MCEWEVHALRNLASSFLYSLDLLSRATNADQAMFTPDGVRKLCRDAFDEFERQRFIAFRDGAFRRAIIRA